eukprot:CAMPEP_0114537942 /NCGR_PEP_ID=MMETSP0109-20121206/29851_1 /TAXON_ID=29199 /ORGANISM="Chlorarachnion reptans, Strain CCCM449" /LENGTH=89 /DNA_ID=CAMNT_0001721873 /DNA_START=973 /DNA_END=1238 /DNA_ORIENTATION=+
MPDIIRVEAVPEEHFAFLALRGPAPRGAGEGEAPQPALYRGGGRRAGFGQAQARGQRRHRRARPQERGRPPAAAPSLPNGAGRRRQPQR